MNPKTRCTFLLAIALAGTAPALADTTEQILQTYVDDYVNDPMIHEVTFGIRVGEREDWHVVATPGDESEPPEVILRRGFPRQPTWYFKLEGPETLGKLDRGELSAGTAAVKAFSTDFAPLDVEVMDGYKPGENFVAEMMRTLFHFWNRGLPEITPFNEDVTRSTHGGEAVVFYYQPGLRSGWFSIRPGQHVNEDPRSRTNPFPTMMVFTAGKGMGRVGGKEVELSEGQMLFIPPEVSHEFLNPYDEPFEGIIVMFGEGA